jgi:hypothetical protein
MWASARLIEEIAFLREAEAFVKTLNGGATMAPDFGRQGLCAGMVNERLKDFPSDTAPAHVFQDRHATKTSTGGQWSIITRLRHKRADADQLSIQEAPNMQGTRRSIAQLYQSESADGRMSQCLTSSFVLKGQKWLFLVGLLSLPGSATS